MFVFLITMYNYQKKYFSMYILMIAVLITCLLYNALKEVSSES